MHSTARAAAAPIRAARPRRTGGRSAARPSRRARSTLRRCGRGSARTPSASSPRRVSRGRSQRRPSARRRPPRSSSAPRGSAAARSRTSSANHDAVARLDADRVVRRPGRAPTRGSRATPASTRRTAAAGRGSRRASPPRAAASSASRNARNTAPRASRVGRSTLPAVVHRQPFAQVGRHLLELHRVPRHQAERLHVHHEPGAACGRPSRAPSAPRGRGSTSSRPRPSRSAPRSRRAAPSAGCPAGTSASRARRRPTSRSRFEPLPSPGHGGARRLVEGVGDPGAVRHRPEAPHAPHATPLPTIAPCPIPGPSASSTRASAD